MKTYAMLEVFVEVDHGMPGQRLAELADVYGGDVSIAIMRESSTITSPSAISALAALRNPTVVDL